MTSPPSRYLVKAIAVRQNECYIAKFWVEVGARDVLVDDEFQPVIRVSDRPRVFPRMSCIDDELRDDKLFGRHSQFVSYAGPGWKTVAERRERRP
jgi:hypothetical protein